MLKPYELLENILIEIENTLKDGVNSESLAKKYALSERHLRRIFLFAFNQTLGEYIRSRKLSASIDDLLNSDQHILDITLNYGFEHEQSFIRSFKREFGITPGDLRRTKQIVKVKPPLYLFDENKMPSGALFGPDIVMVPQFHVIGKSCWIPFADTVSSAPKAAINFWHNERPLISEIINPDIYIGLTRNKHKREDVFEYIPSIQVKNFLNIPQGFISYTFETSLCARFRYLGNHHIYDLNIDTAKTMYDAIWKFYKDEKAKYALLREQIFFERIDTRLFDETYCQMEWFAPVIEKK